MLEAALALAATEGGRFTWSYSYRGSLFLIAGGTFVLGVLTILLLGQSALFGTPGGRGPPPGFTVRTEAPAPPPPLPPAAQERLATDAATDPDSAFALGLEAGSSLGAAAIDDVLDRFAASGLGEPRLTVTETRRKIVLLRSCRTCSAALATRRDAARIRCHYERGFLAGGFAAVAPARVEVRETACRCAGADACRFEVTY